MGEVKWEGTLLGDSWRSTNEVKAETVVLIIASYNLKK